METKVIKEIIKRLKAEPERTITGSIGSGCHARSFGDIENKSYKVVIPGDTFSAALGELHYLLFDLGIDVGLTCEELDNICYK